MNTHYFNPVEQRNFEEMHLKPYYELMLLEARHFLELKNYALFNARLALCKKLIPWASDPVLLEFNVKMNFPRRGEFFDLGISLRNQIIEDKGYDEAQDGSYLEWIKIAGLKWAVANMGNRTMGSDDTPSAIDNLELWLNESKQGIGSVFKPKFTGLGHYHGGLMNSRAVLDFQMRLTGAWRIPSMQDWRKLIQLLFAKVREMKLIYEGYWYEEQLLVCSFQEFFPSSLIDFIYQGSLVPSNLGSIFWATYDKSGSKLCGCLVPYLTDGPLAYRLYAGKSNGFYLKLVKSN
jgi:hypothetical protein